MKKEWLFDFPFKIQKIEIEIQGSFLYQGQEGIEHKN